MLNRPEVILIDLDGTLVDSVPDLRFCVDTMLQTLDMPACGMARVRNWVGNGVERLVRRALVDNLEGEPDEDLFQRAYPIFMRLYAENTALRSHLYPGVTDGLNALRAASYRLGCVTNKAEQFTLPLLESMAIREYFSIVISGDTLAERKPHPLPLLHAAKFFGVRPEQALLLGDSISDVKAARAAGFQVVCVSYGYNHGVDINTAQPDAVIDSVAELPALLARAA